MDDKFCWDILDIYFQHGGSSESVNPLIKHQIDSYNKFIDNTLSQIITGFNPIKIGHGFKQEVNDHIHKIYINVLQPSLTKPMYQLQDGTQTIMTPNIARMNNLTYSSNLYVNVHLVIEVINNDGVIEKIDKNINGVYIGKIPVMVRSKACILSQIPAIGEENNNECKYDFGGYFIINGNEKCLVSQDRINENKTLVFQPNNNSDGLYAEIRSMSDSTYLPPKTTSLNMSGKLNHMGRIIRMSTSFLRNEIPIFIMFRALGVISDQEIIQHIVYDLDNKDNYRIINELMACCEDACDVHTQEQAENVLIKIMTGVNKTVNSKELLSSNIINDFLPHVGKNYRRKALYLGYMIRRMIRIYIGYDTYDNRDSYMNKRIDTPGILMSNLFRQCYGKMTKEMKNLIERELNLWRANQSVPTSEIITDANIHRYFKQSLLDSWLKYSLSTGNWGIKSIGSFQNIRQGVSQVLNRMSYASTLSHLRRINTAMEKNGKLVQPRKLDNSQMGMICPAECFDPNTPILLWNGTIKKAEDIVIGDYLIDDKGNAVRVKSTCSGEKMMYEVIQHKNNFMNYTVTDNHILTLKVRNHKYIRKNKDKIRLEWFDKKELKYKSKTINNFEELDEFSSSIDDDNVIDITIEQYLSLPKSVQNQLYTFKSDGINWETKEVALDPYILGMWLGDGLSHGYGFITADKELLDEYIKWGVNNDATITKSKNKYRYTISSTINNTQTGISCNKSEKAPLKKLLAKYNLINNKHIPLDYLTNDRKTRLAVLAGLIDTDGNVRANGHEIRICQGEPNYKIIYDAEFLARSLGFSCHLNDGMCSYTVNGEKRKKPYKELTITGKYLYEIPTVLPRKKLNKCNNYGHEKRCDSSLLSSFELVQKDVQRFVGWQLDGNGRFLSGDMSIMHNTPEGASVGLVKNLALSTQVSVSMSSAHIRLLLQEFGVIHYNDSYNYNITSEEKWFESNPSIDEARNNITYFLKEMGNYNNVYIQINGDIIGYHTNPVELYNKLKHYKRCGIIHPMTSIIWNIKYRYIYISTEAGRMYRPLLIVDIDKDTGVRELRIAKILREKKLTWEEYIKDKSFDSFVCPIVSDNECSMEEEGFIEYMDCEEINYAMIAINPIELTKGAKGTALPALYTHCEIHPSLINGILGVNVPFSDHNQSPRNCYQCLWENEEVLMSDGTTKMIKDINIGDYVLTFDPETIIVSNTVVVNHMLKDTDKNIVKLTTYSGREIILTDDHNVITNEGWKPSAEFTENTKVGILCDNIYIKKFYENLENKIVLDEETFIQNMKNANIKESLIIKHIKNLKKLSLIPLMNDDDRLPILAGLFGYITTDGSVNIYNKKHGGMTAQVSVTLGRLLDAEKMNEDIAKLGFKSTRINEATRIHPSRGVKHHTFDICYNGMFASYMIGLGIDYGKKTEIQRKPLPEWIINGSKETKRHFLAGFQGGDGCKIKIIKYKNRGSTIALAQTSQQIIPEYSESLEQFMAQIVNMFNEFTIVTKMQSNKIVTANNNKIMVAYYISNNYDNLIKYYETIGYKYSNTKNTKSAVLIEYLKYKKLSNKRCTDINIDDWVNNVEIKGEGIFMPVTITSHKNVRVCDIEVEHKNHSFLTSSGVMISNCAMGKQALGVYMSNFNKRIDTMGSVLNYPQKPLAYTKLSKYTYSNDLPSGINSVVAIMTHTGFNQEDSVMINKSALDRGLYVSTYYKAFRDQCTKNHSTGEEEIFTNPKNSVSLKPYSYEKLDESGFVPKNTYVDGNDIIVGKVMPKKNNGVITQQDNSMCMKANDEGYIDLNYTGVNSEGYKFCKVRVRKNRKPEIGDKLASRSAQKGTIGMVYNHQDMPFTKDGIVPDIIMNPHAIPSRMTMGQLMECIMGKAACHIGSTGDATPFTDCSVESIAKVLEMSGMERYGNEIMYCGRTGEQIQTEIFIGPTYYQRLKHMVQDKLHSRGSNGPIVMLTRQPSEGRARNGGLRLGEMERDCLVAHGMSSFLKERMLDVSDNYRLFICKTCGVMANVNPDNNIYQCKMCGNQLDISQVRMPYAFKLLSQELATMNILMRFAV
jgi:DNA-directed RNA polymerase beta subunit